MNNQLSGLDPKTQETFHRVMNTPTQPIPPVQTAPQAPPVTPTPFTSNPTPVSEQPQVFTPQQPTPPAAEVKEEAVIVQAPQAPVVNAANSQVFSSKKKSGQITPIVMILGIAVFLVVYTLVWVKIFGASLPFLP